MPPTKIQCRIYQPPKSSMQSGRARPGAWVLDYEIATARRPEPLMGWTSSDDTLNQVRLRFTSREDAVSFAEREGMGYTIEMPKPRRVMPRNYADNFRYAPPKAPAAGTK